MKQFRRGLIQMDEEGVVQVLRDDDGTEVSAVLAAVGQMQFEVLVHRLEHEFGAAAELVATPYNVARRTDEATALELRGVSGVRVLFAADGTRFALFESPYRLQRLQNEHPDWCLERVLSE